MVNEKLRKVLDDLLECSVIIESFDESIVGITNDERIVYDYTLMVEEFAKDNGCSLEDAEDTIHYNTLRALPYIKGKEPLVIVTTREDLDNMIQ